MEESRNNLNLSIILISILNNAYHTWQISFQEDLSFLFIPSPSEKPRPSITQQPRWPEASPSVVATPTSAWPGKSPVEISGFYTWTLNLGSSEMLCGTENAHLPGSDAPSRSINEPWKMKDQRSNIQRSLWFCRKWFGIFRRLWFFCTILCCIFYTLITMIVIIIMSWQCHDSTFIVILIDYLDIQHKTVFRNELRRAFWS